MVAARRVGMTAGNKRRRHGWTGIDGDYGSVIQVLQQRAVRRAGGQVLDHQVLQAGVGSLSG
jgi:hypothetical protein